MIIELDSYSLTLTHSHMRLKWKMYTRTFGMTKSCSIIATIRNSPYYCNVNKKVIGKFKDEACCVPIVEFVGPKSKTYSYIKDNEKGGRTAKRIKKNVIKNNIKHEDYKSTLINSEQMHHKMKIIRSQRHQLVSYEINKVSLSCFDDKCYIHDNGTSSYAYGHYNI